MTEIPEHLLKRSRAAKGKGDEAPAAAASSSAVTPAKAEAASAGPPAIAAAAAAIPKDKEPAPAPPAAHYVEAARGRNKIPMWVLPLLVLLPIWAISFAGTMQLPPSEDHLYVNASELYVSSGCAGCHGATGGGGTGYALSGGSVLATFPDAIDQMVHVKRGSAALDGATYGAERADGVRIAGAKGSMPAHHILTQLELELVVFHERAVLSEEDTSSDAYIEWMESMRERIEAGDATEADLDGLLACADPAITPAATGGGEECAGPSHGTE